MAPSDKKLEAALITGTCDVFGREPDATSVNKVRRHVEKDLDLEEGFFDNEKWKKKSKLLIKEYVEKLLDGWKPDAKEESDAENGVKRQSPESESPAPKRQKRAAKPKKALKKEDFNASDYSEGDEKPKKKKLAPKSKSKSKVEESDEEDDVLKSSQSPDRKRKREDEDELEDEDKSEPEIKVKTKKQDSVGDDSNDPKAEGSDAEDTKGSLKKEDSVPAENEEEEYSDVIDEPPKPKRKKKDHKDPKAPKPPKASKSKDQKARPSLPDDPDEAEIKKLQSHLAKCGIRKLWHNELKRYEDDSRAKIRHLRKMLSDVGMEGRFSEAKARDIKEMRELMADAEAAQEMNALWGMNERGRSSRSKNKGKSLKEESEDSGEEAANGNKGVKDEDDDDEDEGETFAARRRRAQADLAFLGDDSDSD